VQSIPLISDHAREDHRFIAFEREREDNEKKILWGSLLTSSFVAELHKEREALAILTGMIPVIQWRKLCIPRIDKQGRILYGLF
jgi:hypothetical protein